MSATTAEHSGCPYAKTAEAGACPYHDKNASMASTAGCEHGAKGASMASASGCEHGAKGASMASASGCEHGAKDASMASSGGCEHGAKGAGFDASVTGDSKCSGHGMAAFSDGSSHHDCDACADMAHCDAEVKAAGGQSQVVKLKNGVMYVYTAGSPAQVRAVQAVMSRRSDRLVAMAAAGDRAKLCPECKAMRGAIASGKLNREIVTIEGGCLTLMTSNDPSIVAKLHRMAGTEMAARVKS
jgi:hypothetical protein